MNNFYKNISIFIVAAVIIWIGFSYVANKINVEDSSNNENGMPIVNELGETVLESGVKYKDEKEGTGEGAKAGDTLTVHYTGILTNGETFDSSKPRNQPFSFTLGAGDVIKGWDEGMVGMKSGGNRQLFIPPDSGYGSRAVGKIPANSPLIFEVELLKIQ